MQHQRTKPGKFTVEDSPCCHDKIEKPLATVRKWLFSGGVGNRTRVPRYFHAGIYVCSEFMLVACLAVPLVRLSWPQLAGYKTHYQSAFLADAAPETNEVTLTLEHPRSGIGVRTATSPTKGTERLVGY
jgi:hypothetical protein